MKKHSHINIMSIVVFSIVTISTQAIAGEASGVWKMQTSASANPLEPLLGNKFIIEKDSSNVKFYNMENLIVAEGNISGNSISAKALGKYGTYTIKGDIVGSKINGTVSLLTGQEVEWKATKLGALYKCGNHDPAHSAVTMEEMQRYSKEMKCAQWSIVP